MQIALIDDRGNVLDSIEFKREEILEDMPQIERLTTCSSSIFSDLASTLEVLHDHEDL